MCGQQFGQPMTRLMSLIAMFMASTFATASADACMVNKIYPTFWKQPPLFPQPNEVVLRVETKAYSSLEREDGFSTSCEGGAFVFEVVEVLRGTFEDSELVLVMPLPGELYDQPGPGERRILVGRVLTPVKLTSRSLDNRTEINALIKSGVSGFVAFNRYSSQPTGGPTVVMALDHRAPIELPALMLGSALSMAFSAQPLVLKVGIFFAVLGLIAVLIATWRLLTRKRRHP